MISEQDITHAHNESANTQEHSDPLSVIGISLVIGFIFMLIVDQVLVIGIAKKFVLKIHIF